MKRHYANKSSAAKAFLCALVILTVASCEPVTREVEDDELAIPPELSECKFFWMKNSKNTRFLITRCPHSTTTTKGYKMTTVLDDVGSDIEK